MVFILRSLVWCVLDSPNPSGVNGVALVLSGDLSTARLVTLFLVTTMFVGGVDMLARHLRMTGMSLEIFDPKTGRRETVSQVSNWSPLWHLSHVYEDDVAPLVPAGSVLRGGARSPRARHRSVTGAMKRPVV